MTSKPNQKLVIVHSYYYPKLTSTVSIVGASTILAKSIFVHRKTYSEVEYFVRAASNTNSYFHTHQAR